MILGTTIYTRTNSYENKLYSGVSSIWGEPQTQTPPKVSYLKATQTKVDSVIDGKAVTKTETSYVPEYLPVNASDIRVSLALDYRQKGLLWYSTYTVDFNAFYSFVNSDSAAHGVSFVLKFPAAHAIYDNVVFEVDGKPAAFSSGPDGLAAAGEMSPHQTVQMRVAYRSHGLNSWTYKLADEVAQWRNFKLVMNTNFKDIDFPGDTLSPVDKRETSGGWQLTWRYTNLISGFAIGMVMPEKLQPGPLASQISYFAPVSLLLFFFVMFIITSLRDIELHPMNYFFLAAAFFSFHLLLAYTVDRISIHLAFLICSAVSIFLVVSYLRLVVGARFAFVEAGLAQFVYLVLFSYSFFLKGFTGLAITLGCIVTLFIAMQLTGRIKWKERFN